MSNHAPDHAARTARLQAALAEAGTAAALFADADAVYWLSGFCNYLGLEFGRATLLFVPAEGEPTLITPLMESDMARRMTWVADVRTWMDGEDNEWRRPLAALLGELGAGRLGVEAATLPAPVAAVVRGALPPERLGDASPVLAGLRMIKEPGEIETMRQAGQVAVAMVEGARGAIGEGVPEYEVALAVIAGGTRKAAELLGEDDDARFQSPTIYNLQILQSGADTCMVHRRSSTRRLRRGDPVYLCFCGIANFRQYKLGFDRQFYVGEVRDDEARACEATLAAQAAALAAIRPGAVAAEVHAAACEAYRSHGFAPGYRTGRGVGCSFLEPPELKSGETTVLEAGMTFAVDGGITVEGRYGARVGDSIVVTEDGYESLTPYPKGVVVI